MITEKTKMRDDNVIQEWDLIFENIIQKRKERIDNVRWKDCISQKRERDPIYIQSLPTFDVFISQFIKYARVCSSYECFIPRAVHNFK